MFEQEGFAHASWLYGQWLARQAHTMNLQVIHTQPQQTILLPIPFILVNKLLEHFSEKAIGGAKLRKPDTQHHATHYR